MPLGFHRVSSLEEKNWSGRHGSTTGTATSGNGSHGLSTAFTELFAATAFDTWWIQVRITATSASATQTDQLLNIYTGAASSEQVLIPNLLAGWSHINNSGLRKPRVYGFPLYIPAGTRLTVKNQSLISGDSARVSVSLNGGGYPPFWVGRKVECLGADTANSRGTSVTPGTTSEGTFVDMGTSTYDYGYVLPTMQGTLTDTVSTRNLTALDIGVGDALYKDLEGFLCHIDDAEGTNITTNAGRWTYMPAGNTYQLRGQNSGAAEAYDAAIYGVY